MTIELIFLAAVAAASFFIGMIVSYRHCRAKVIDACVKLTNEINSGKWAKNEDDETMLMQLIGAKECLLLLIRNL